MYRFAIALLAATLSPFSYAQMPVSSETRATVSRIVGDVMVNGQAYEYDRQLADTVGPRLTGSSNYVHAVAWAQDQFKQLGLSNVHTEAWKMKATWEPETAATGRIITPREQTLHIYSMGWSPSTPGSGVKGDVVYLQHLTPEGLDAQKDKIGGNVVLLDNKSMADLELTQLLRSLDKLGRLGPRAVMIVGGANGTESASALSFDGSIAPVPIAQVGYEDVQLMKRMLEHGPVSVEFSFKNRIRKDVEVNNVVAEIPGSELPNEVVIVGAHLDSWHPATGAQDNGTGVATALDVARAIKASGKAPRRTVRFVLFGGEEQGLIGSVAYAKAHAAEMPSIDCVLISDTGAQPAKGWYVMGREDETPALSNVEPLLAGLGSNQTTTSVEFLYETDHIGFDVQGVPTLVLWNDTDKYFKLHHKASDSFDSVNQADLNQGVATTAATAYAIADSAQRIAPHDTPAQVEEFLKKANQWDDYQYFKSTGVLP
ncbi:MAG: M20/M25/M40 family metallo-hydrolase [Edaphobacter sp.]|uniref:M20/M25/M40 family metallo-hydrolase n=1 Tax=Edaphobacter sp. TaxID=1934404 RepID=UPI002389BC15|nr:M20/M25/M40 family metallo-hydrolase [Edaphobacter sp.]MDE1178656.1 M20/M25/M40 family metallo-hydrolase [Edaphobacter sp.]